jgi:hypothetical protein
MSFQYHFQINSLNLQQLQQPLNATATPRRAGGEGWRSPGLSSKGLDFALIWH